MSSLKRSVVLVSILSILGRAVEAQVPRPPPRGNNNDHKTSAEQDEIITEFAKAWAVCLSPHVGSRTEEQIRVGVEGILQNQYSEWATYDFWQEIGDLVYEDLGMLGFVSKPKKEAALAPGGALVPLVDGLLAKAVASSGDVLAFYGSRDGRSFQSQHELLLRKDPGTVGAVLGLLRRHDLTKEQVIGAQELADHYHQCFRESLPIAVSPKDKARFQSMVLEMLRQPDADVAVRGLRAKLRFAVRNEVKGIRMRDSVPDFLALDGEVEAFLTTRIPEGFWAKLRSHHEEMMADPKKYRPLFEREKCEL